MRKNERIENKKKNQSKIIKVGKGR